jgi:hypothetical protein
MNNKEASGISPLIDILIIAIIYFEYGISKYFVCFMRFAFQQTSLLNCFY